MGGLPTQAVDGVPGQRPQSEGDGETQEKLLPMDGAEDAGCPQGWVEEEARPALVANAIRAAELERGIQGDGDESASARQVDQRAADARQSLRQFHAPSTRPMMRRSSRSGAGITMSS